MTNQKLQILLVDDSDLVLRHTAGLLASKGWSIVAASSMAKALEQYCRRPPQVLLVDFVLEEGHTGLEVISAIFALSASNQATGGGGLPSPKAAILTLGALSEADQGRAAYLGVPVFQKPSRGKEEEFLQNIEFWLHDSGLI